jgi:hypothetical protein
MLTIFATGRSDFQTPLSLFPHQQQQLDSVVSLFSLTQFFGWVNAFFFSPLLST